MLLVMMIYSELKQVYVIYSNSRLTVAHWNDKSCSPYLSIRSHTSILPFCLAIKKTPKIMNRLKHWALHTTQHVHRWAKMRLSHSDYIVHTVQLNKFASINRSDVHVYTVYSYYYTCIHVHVHVDWWTSVT